MSGNSPAVFVTAILFLVAISLTIGIIDAWKKGRPLLVAMLVLAASIGTQVFVRILFEAQGVGFDVLDVQAWPLTVLIGDLLVLPSVAALATIGWSEVDRYAAEAYWYRSRWRFAACVAAGAMAGTVFHVFSQVPGYTAAGLAAATWSPSMLAHDFVTYPVIVAVLLYIVPPIVWRRWRGEGWVIVVLVLVFGLLMWHDATAGLDPSTFHPQLDIRNL